LWKKDPAASVLDRLGSSECLIPVVVIAEIQEGAEATPSLARREEISRKLAKFHLILNWSGRCSPVFDFSRQPINVKLIQNNEYHTRIDRL
jgi:hypothetical protein